MRIFGFEISRAKQKTERKVFANDKERLMLVWSDADALMYENFSGKHWSRREMETQGMSQSRWNKAYELLKLSNCVSGTGRVRAINYDAASEMLKGTVMQIMYNMSDNPNYVLPF